jgi:haloalkane dehalogenase
MLMGPALNGVKLYVKRDDLMGLAPRFTDAPGFRMYYVDERPADAQVVLCLHGEPTWGYLFRDLIAALGSTYPVIAPDHMGFGKSDTPQDRSYWLQDHIDNLERFVLALDLRAITLVMHDFGGPVGMGPLQIKERRQSSRAPFARWLQPRHRSSESVAR